MIKNAIIFGKKIIKPTIYDFSLNGNFSWTSNICENSLTNPWNYINFT